MRRIMLGALSAVTLFLAVGGNALAYNLYGGAWPWTSIGYCITTSYGDHSTRWALGLGNWNAATSTIHFYQDCAGNDIGLLDANYTGETWAGLATLSPCTSCTYSAGWGWMNYAVTQYATPQERTAIAGHELGHLLGLAHASGSVLMNGTIDGAINTPQTDDINGVEAIY